MQLVYILIAICMVRKYFEQRLEIEQINRKQEEIVKKMSIRKIKLITKMST